MNLDNKVVFVTGANRGIGRAIVETLLKYDVKKIYAASRKVSDLPNFEDPRVVPIQLDITDATQIQQAVIQAKDTQVLINNAGVLAIASVVDGPIDQIKHDMDVNYYGTLSVTRSFVPFIQQNGGGSIAAISSIVGLSSLSKIGGYSASKAALFSAIQSMRAELKPKNIDVYGIFPGPIDTDMAKSMNMKNGSSVSETADNIVKEIIAGEHYIFPDEASKQWGALWMKNPKELERQFSS